VINTILNHKLILLCEIIIPSDHNNRHFVFLLNFFSLLFVILFYFVFFFSL